MSRTTQRELRFEADTTSDDPLKGGILSNPLLAQSARTVSFTSKLTIVDNGTSFSYEDPSEQQRAIHRARSSTPTRIPSIASDRR